MMRGYTKVPTRDVSLTLCCDTWSLKAWRWSNISPYTLYLFCRILSLVGKHSMISWKGLLMDLHLIVSIMFSFSHLTWSFLNLAKFLAKIIFPHGRRWSVNGGTWETSLTLVSSLHLTIGLFVIETFRRAGVDLELHGFLFLRGSWYSTQSFIVVVKLLIICRILSISSFTLGSLSLRIILCWPLHWFCLELYALLQSLPSKNRLVDPLLWFFFIHVVLRIMIRL